MDGDSQSIATLQQENQRLRDEVAALKAERDEASARHRLIEDVLEQSSVPTCFWLGERLVYQFANHAYRIGSGKHNPIGKTVQEVFEEREIPGLTPLLEQVYTSGKPQTVNEALVRLPNPETGVEEERWYNLVYNPVRDEQGKVVGVSNFAVEVTSQVRARQELYRQAQILDQVRGSVIVTDLDGIIINWNQDSTRIYGYEPAEVIGQPVAIIYPPERHEWLLNEVVRPLQAKGTHETETIAWNKAGERLPTYLSLSLLRDEHGTPVGMIGYSIDISERKRWEEELRTFKALVENTLDGVAMASPEGILIYANPAFQAMSGFGKDLFDRPVIDLYPVDLHPYISEEVIPAIRQEGMWQGTMELCRPDGSRWLAQHSVFAIRNEQGQIIRMANLLRDITEARRQEEEMRVFQTLIENAPLGVNRVSLQGKIVFANSAFRTMTGYGDEVIGMNIQQLHPEQERHRSASAVQHLMEKGVARETLSFQRKDGHTFLGSIIAFLVYSSDGELQEIVSFHQDVTEQKQAEEERLTLQQQIIDAQRDALRELSTPLIPITDDVMIMPLIGAIDSRRAQQVMEALLEGVAHYQVDLVILDITGVRVVDTQVAQAFIQAAQAVRLLGTRVMLTGIGPQIAQTLIHLGVDFSEMTTHGSLQAGIAAAFHRNSR